MDSHPAHGNKCHLCGKSALSH